METETFEIGRRRRNLPPPPRIVWQSLTDPLRPRTRPWLFLLEDEVEPRVLEAEEPHFVRWSSIWPRFPDEMVRFELAPAGSSGTSLTWTLTSPVELDTSAVGHQRLRLNTLLWADLRFSYGQ